MARKILEFVVGSGIKDSPIAGVNTWQPDFLRYCIIEKSEVNGIPEYQSNPAPNYIHNYVDGMMTRIKPDTTPNIWEINDKIVLTINTPE